MLKTKLLVVSTKELKDSKVINGQHKVKIKVGDKVITETDDDKLLGIMMSSNMKRSTYLYGNQRQGKERIVGLIPSLSQ